MCSIISLVCPYGLVALVGSVSSTGTDAGSPYTVADDEKTICLTPFLAMVCRRETAPLTLQS
jgi:hypothetical protein